jgi:hypothetical protein
LPGGELVSLPTNEMDQDEAEHEYDAANYKARPTEPRVFAITGKQRLGKGDRNADAPHRMQGEHE